MTAILSLYHKEFSQSPKTSSDFGEVSATMVQRLKPCECGGFFRRGASPRCPNCDEALSAELASIYIERNAQGTAKGWRWQKNWLYCIIVEGKVVNDNFRT